MALLTDKQHQELTTLAQCLSAVADLTIPCEDLHAVNRENLSALLTYIAERLDIEEKRNINDYRACHLAIQSLMANDSHLIDRDHVAILLQYLSERMVSALKGGEL